MGRGNVGEIPEVTADEDVDRDIEIAESTKVKERDARRAAARRRIEELKEEKEQCQ